MQEIKTKLGQSGRIVIPTEYRRRLGLKSGDEIIMRMDDRGLHLYTHAQAVARAQALVRRYVPEGRSLSDELISERREKTSRE